MAELLDLGLLDPMPGDPEEIRRESRRMAKVAAELRESISALRFLALEQKLEGQYAGRLVSLAGNLANRFETLVVRYETVGPIIDDWANHLEYAKDAAARAAREGRAAADLRKAALLEPPAALDPVSVAMAEQRRRAALEEAERLWDLARRDLIRAGEYAERMGHLAAKAIRDAIDDDLKDPSGGFLGLKDAWRAVDGFVDGHAEILQDVAKWTGYLGTVTTFAALACPPLAGVAVGLTAVTAALDAGLAATGNENWANVALDAAALKALGMSRRAVQGFKSAERSAVSGAEGVARSRAAAQVIARNEARLRNAQDLARSPVDQPAKRLQGQLTMARIEREAGAAAARAVREVDTIPVRRASTADAARAGGLREAESMNRVDALGAEFAGHPAVTKPAASAREAHDVNRHLWWGTATVDTADKVAGDGCQAAGTPVYHNFKERFTMEIGSAW